jgi:hypothetical protein
VVSDLASPVLVSQETLEERRNRITRVLSRLEVAESEPLPAKLQDLMTEILGAPPARAEAMETELRFQVQAHNTEQRTRRQEASEAEQLLLALPPAEEDLDNAAVARELQAVACGRGRLTDSLRRCAAEVTERAARRQDERYAGKVVRMALAELGYEVGDDFSTLFVEGGDVHVQRPDWGEYFLAMKVDAQDSFMNFRLVRATNDTADPQERQRLDREREAQWCGEYPKLIRALQAKGIHTRNLRALPPGTMPVQRVAADAIGKARAGRSRRPNSIIAARRTKAP